MRIVVTEGRWETKEGKHRRQLAGVSSKWTEQGGGKGGNTPALASLPCDLNGGHLRTGRAGGGGALHEEFLISVASITVCHQGAG